MKNINKPATNISSECTIFFNDKNYVPLNKNINSATIQITKKGINL